MTRAARLNCQNWIVSPAFRGLPRSLFSFSIVPFQRLQKDSQAAGARTTQERNRPAKSTVSPGAHFVHEVRLPIRLPLWISKRLKTAVPPQISPQAVVFPLQPFSQWRRPTYERARCAGLRSNGADENFSKR